MKNYTDEQVKAFMSENVPKIPSVEIVKPIPNLVPGPVEDFRELTKVKKWGWYVNGWGEEATRTYMDDGSILVKNVESNIWIVKSSSDSPIELGESRTYTISAYFKNVSEAELPVTIQVIEHRTQSSLTPIQTIETINRIDFDDGWYLLWGTVTLSETTFDISIRFCSCPKNSTCTNEYYIRKPAVVEGSEPNLSVEMPIGNIIAESFEYNHILDTNKALAFWGTNSASLKLQCAGISEDYRNYEIIVKIKAGDFEIKYFDGIIESQTNQNHEDIITTLTCYDFMYKVKQLDLTEWYDQYDWTADGGNYLGSFASSVLRKINEEISEIIVDIDELNKSFSIVGKYVTTKPDLESLYGYLTAEVLLNMIAEYEKVYFYFDGISLKAKKLNPISEGLHPHIGLYPSVGLVPYEGGYDERYAKSDYIAATYEPYKTEKIDRVVAVGSNNKIAGASDDIGEKAEGKNVMYVKLMTPFDTEPPNSSAIAYTRGVLSIVKDVTFTPSKIQAIYDPRIEIGDIVKVYTSKNIIYSYILQKNVKGIQAMIATYTNKSDQFQTAQGGLK